MTVGLGRSDISHPWLLDRCKEVQNEPDGCLDLWARAHYKSSIITLGLTIQDILASHGDDPLPKWNGCEITVGILSVTRPLAKQFLAQIKREFESNDVLRGYFPDIIWENPNRDAPSWSLDSGIILKRKSNPKEPVDCNELILTTKGWKKHGDIVVGDCVFTPKGTSVPVINVTQKSSVLPCYRVTFGNESIVVAATHKWLVSKLFMSRDMRRSGKKSREIYNIYTTEELWHEIERNQQNRFAVQITKPLCLPDAVLPIDPYVLGAWLGDGSKNSARFVSSKADFSHFEQEFKKAGHAIHIYNESQNKVEFQLDKRDRTKICRRGHNMTIVGTDKGGRCKECNKDRSAPYTVDGLSWRLRRLGLLNNKHVPNLYLMASKKQRLALLQGLMDTDGCASAKDGQSIFANTNKQLSESVYFLAASLGMRPTIKRRERKYKGSPHIMWWVTFQGYSDFPPFRMQRKVDNCSNSVTSHRRTRRVISKIEKAESCEVSCIQVGSKDGLYLVGKSFITTHNSTVEAWGLVDSQPTSKHFEILMYDDVVTVDSTRSPDMIEKTTQAWELSLNLGTATAKYRYAGTRYHFNDTYRTIMEREAAKPRVHPATVDGTVTGEPVLLSIEVLNKKRKDMGSYSFASQLLLNPVADNNQGFLRSWLVFHGSKSFEHVNRYIIVDPANEKKKSNDYTVITVLGLGADNNYYTIDWVRDRLSLTERGNMLFYMHRKYKPKDVGYEHYGMQADIAYLKDKMKRDNYNFKITPLGGNLAKVDRIKALIPIFEQGRMYLPETCYKTNYEGKTEDLTEVFLTHEYDTFPVCQHDDMLDCMARILHVHEDWKVIWPRRYEDEDVELEQRSYSTWSA